MSEPNQLGMVKYVYTLSSINDMFEWTVLSIKSLRSQVDPENIVVFYTPPRHENHVTQLRSLGVDVRLVKNSTDAFSAVGTKQHYGEKTWLTTSEDDTVCFLDCDTLVFGDIAEATQGDFQFKARPGTSTVHQPGWTNLFQRFDETYMDWMPNAGFLMFKQGIHGDIGEKWREYIQTDLDYQHKVNHKEQYALALAVGSADAVQMDSEEHAMLWNDEYPANGAVYHIGNVFDDSLTDIVKSGISFKLQELRKGNS